EDLTNFKGDKSMEHPIRQRVMDVTRARPDMDGRFWKYLKQNLAYISLVVLIVLFTITGGDNFLSWRNWTYIVQQEPVLMTLAIAETIVITGGFIDLSVRSVLGLATYSAALGVGLFEPAGLLLAPIVALIVGVLNGTIFAYLKIPSFI